MAELGWQVFNVQDYSLLFMYTSKETHSKPEWYYHKNEEDNVHTVLFVNNFLTYNEILLSYKNSTKVNAIAPGAPVGPQDSSEEQWWEQVTWPQGSHFNQPACPIHITVIIQTLPFLQIIIDEYFWIMILYSSILQLTVYSKTWNMSNPKIQIKNYENLQYEH